MTEPTPQSTVHIDATHTELPSLVGFLREFFQARGDCAYLVGGAIRDCLLGLQPQDVDIAVEGDVAGVGSDLAEALGGRFIMMHQDMDIGRVTVPADAVDENTVAYVDLSGIDGGLDADLRRRDFTIDSMALPLAVESVERQHIIDPMGGLTDLEDGVIRANGDETFRDDPARLLRAPRLAAQMGFVIDNDTEAKIRRDAGLVSGVTPERIRDGLMRLLSAPIAAKSIRWLDAMGLLSLVLPELDESRGVAQPKEHHWDVFNHLVEAVGHVDRILGPRPVGLPNDCGYVYSLVPRFDGIDEYFQEEVGDGHTRLTFLKLAALLHDIAKPVTKTQEPSGRIRFLGHDAVGEEMVGKILERLRFSRRGSRLVMQMVRYHLRPTQMAARGEMPSGRALYRYYRDVTEGAIDTLYLNMADFLAARGPTITEPDWRDHCELMDHILTKGRRQNGPETLPKIITGHDIMVALSLSPGPEVGRLLGLAHEAQANGEVKSLEDALELVESLTHSRKEPGGCGA